MRFDKYPKKYQKRWGSILVELYISTDIEANGPCPGLYSMLSFGSAVFDGESETPLVTFYVNLEVLPEAGVHPDTVNFWKENAAAYAATRVDLKAPLAAMWEYSKWLGNLDGKPVFVGYPAAFDFNFIYWYLYKFTGDCPFGWHALDIKTQAMSCLGFQNYHTAVKKNFPPSWFGDMPHTHHALDDAIEQGVLFTRIRKELKVLHDRTAKTY